MVGVKLQFSDEIVKPRYLKILTFSMALPLKLRLVASIENHNFSFFDINFKLPSLTVFSYLAVAVVVAVVVHEKEKKIQIFSMPYDGYSS